MSLDKERRKQLRAIAHYLKPVVIVGEAGSTPGLRDELERALRDHELIKIKLPAVEREDRAALLAELCTDRNAELVQSIGRTAVLYRHSPNPDPKLSNVLRHQAGKLGSG